MADDAKISESPKSGQIYSGAYRNSRKRRKSLAAANTDIASVSLRPNSIIPGGQSYKPPTIVIYDSRVVLDLKLPHNTTLES